MHIYAYMPVTISLKLENLFRPKTFLLKQYFLKILKI